MKKPTVKEIKNKVIKSAQNFTYPDSKTVDDWSMSRRRTDFFEREYRKAQVTEALPGVQAPKMLSNAKTNANTAKADEKKAHDKILKSVRENRKKQDQ
jgi:hypothetical protein